MKRQSLKKISIAIVVLILSYGLFIQITGSAVFTSKDRQIFEKIDSFSVTELAQACEQMSSFSYVSGLTDGAFLPFGGRTYYYKFYCYSQLAAKTLDAKFCEKVRSRFSILGGGSSVSEPSCLQQVAQAKQREKDNRTKADTNNQLKQDALKIANLQIKRVAKNQWHVRVDLRGQLNGTYKIVGKNLKAQSDRSLFAQTFQANAGFRSEGQWALVGQKEFVFSEKELATCEGCSLVKPQIIPVAVSLSVESADNGSVLSDIKNASIRLE